MPVNLLISLPPIPAPWTIPMPKQAAEGQAFMLAKHSQAASTSASGVVPFEPPEQRPPEPTSSANEQGATRRSTTSVDRDPPLEQYTSDGRVVGRSAEDAVAAQRRLPPGGIDL